MLIAVGAINICIYPNCSGEDLHKVVVLKNFKGVATSLEALMYNGMNHGLNGAPGNYQNNRIPNKEDRSSSSVTIGVSDKHVGLVVGRGGRSIMEISQLSGARIKISDRGDFIAGTSNRKVTISGSQRAIRVAESMIMDKVAAVAE